MLKCIDFLAGTLDARNHVRALMVWNLYGNVRNFMGYPYGQINPKIPLDLDNLLSIRAGNR